MGLRSAVLILVAVLTFVAAGLIERIDKFEGDDCPLKAGGTGICRKTSECINGLTVLKQERHCEFDGRNAVVCCPKAEYTIQASRVAKDKCGKVPPRSGPMLADHVVGITFKANVGDFPFIGLITYENPELRCGASLISSKFLLTATHCFRGKLVSVRMGTNLVTDPSADTYMIAKTHRHSDYNRYVKQDDIGLVELSEEVRMNANVEPICLHTALGDLATTTDLTVIGWGIKNTDRNELSDDLLSGIVHPVPRSTCQAQYAGNKIKFTEKQLCAVGKNDSQGVQTDACGGDSGGPLVIREDNKYFLVGLVSVGAGCGSGVPGVYTRVAHYLQWISERVWNV